jgi:hypothetical protein
VRVIPVEGLGAGHDDEEADHPGRDSAADDVDPLELPVARLELLVDRVGLDEGETPRREGGPQGGRRNEDGVALEGKIGNGKPSCRLAPVGVGEEPGGDVGEEDGGDDEQHDLHPVEASEEHERRHGDGRHGNAHVAGDAADLQPGGDAGHLGRRRAQVGDDQETGGGEAGLYSVPQADDADEAFPVAIPSRTARSWKRTSAAVEIRSVHSSR